MMDSLSSACGMGGPAIAAMAAGMGLAALLSLVLIVLGVLSILWLVRSLRLSPEVAGGALAQGRS